VHWLELTSDDLPRAARWCEGLCLLPFGVIERHGPHLPLGTDQICADAVARQAAERELAVVFPSYFFGKIYTARHCPGTFVTGRRLILRLLEAVLDEIGRNGFTKILILNGHGGNTALLHFFLRSLLEERRPYAVYATNYYALEGEARERWAQMRRTDFGDHGDEMETSVMLHLAPHLVHMEALRRPEDGLPRGLQKHLIDLDSPVGWYADHPTHYSGDARAATAEKGRFVFEAWVDKVVRRMQAVKADRVTPELQEGFYDRAERPGLEGF